MKVHFFFDNNNQLRKTMNDDLKIKTMNNWTCIDNKGVIYKFGENNMFSNTSINSFANDGTSVFNPMRSGNGITEWKLTSITTKNDSRIDFSYINYPLEYTLSAGSVKRVSDYSRRTTTHSTQYSFNNKLINRIETPNIVIEFDYATDATATVWKKKLTGIKILTKNGGLYKEFTFEYDAYIGCAKLRLRKVIEHGLNLSDIQKTWQFNYLNNRLPDMDSEDTDFFGYYNAANNTGQIPLSYNSKDASFEIINTKGVNSAEITVGILDEIIYPTGGKTKFYYEANQEFLNRQSSFAPGVRLKKVEDYSDAINKYNVKEFRYSGLTGNIFNENSNDYSAFRETFPNGLVVLYSSPKRIINPKIGFGYKQIETCYYSNNVFQGKELDYYKFYTVGLTTTYPKIETKIVFNKSLTRIKKMKYTYSTNYSDSKMLGWRIDTEDSNTPIEVFCNTSDWTCHRYKGVYKDYRYDIHDAILLSRLSTIDYIANDSITNTIVYDYDSNLQLIKEFRCESKENTEYLKIIEYPTSSQQTVLHAKEMIGLPVGISEYKICHTTVPITNTIRYTRMDSLIIGKNKMEYDNNGNLTSLYDFVNSKETDYLSLKASYSYNSTGKLQEIHTRDGMSVVYLWSYNNQYPIAEIKNAIYADVKSALGYEDNQIEALASSSNPNIDDIRQKLSTYFFNKQVLFTTYSYIPLFGMVKATDSRGVTTNYDYDTFSRLKNIKDTNGKILQQFDYHYGQQ